MSKIWLTNSDLQMLLLDQINFNGNRTLTIFAEEEIVPGKLNYSILEISNSEIKAGLNIIKPWNYSINKEQLVPIIRKIHRGILLKNVMPLILHHWNPCDKEHLPVNNSDVLISISYDKDTNELFGASKWHLGKFKKNLFFQPYIKGSFIKELTLYRYKDYTTNAVYVQKAKMHNIPFYKALKWISLKTILEIIESKDGRSKNETAIHNLE